MVVYTGGCTANVAIVAPYRSGTVVPDGVVVSSLFDPDSPVAIVKAVDLNIPDQSQELTVGISPERYYLSCTHFRLR